MEQNIKLEIEIDGVVIRERKDNLFNRYLDTMVLLIFDLKKTLYSHIFKMYIRINSQVKKYLKCKKSKLKRIGGKYMRKISVMSK